MGINSRSQSSERGLGSTPPPSPHRLRRRSGPGTSASERARPSSQWGATGRGGRPIGVKGRDHKEGRGRGAAVGSAPCRPACGEGGNCVRGGGRGACGPKSLGIRVFLGSQTPMDPGVCVSTDPNPNGFTCVSMDPNLCGFACVSMVPKSCGYWSACPYGPKSLWIRESDP